MIAHDLLIEPLISWRDTNRRRGSATLPEVLARLATGELADFPAAQAHQLEPWCMFITQLAAVALRNAGADDPRLAEAEWRSLLLRLTAGSHEPWCLVVEDLSKAAFFQPPVPERSVELWEQADHPDDVDVLATAKAHDVKRSRIAATDVQAWALALVTLQTTEGVFGAGKYGISRMKGGYGSRPRVGSAPNLGLGDRFSRDVAVLLASSGSLLKRGFSERGASLVWALPWDGTDSLEVDRLAPHFIEICRRLRLVAVEAGMGCRYTTSKTRRCMASEKSGDVGDVWIPVERSDRGALTIGRRGFHYDLLTRVLFEGGFEPAAAQTIRPEDGDSVFFVASGMARGQGKTDGLHSRRIPLPQDVRRRLGHPEARAALGARAANNVQAAAAMRQRVLLPAIKQLALGERVVQDEFDERVNEVFFDDLFVALEGTEEVAQLAWDRRLYQLAWAELQRAVQRCSVPSIRWYRKVSDAEGMFWGCLTKQFPTLTASLRDTHPLIGEAS